MALEDAGLESRGDESGTGSRPSCSHWRHWPLSSLRINQTVGGPCVHKVSPFRSVRAVGVYLLNLLAAVIGTKVVEDPFDHFVHFSDRTSAAILKADFLTSTVAFGLGYFVYRRWQPASARWAWVAGACWFGLGALHILGGRQRTML